MPRFGRYSQHSIQTRMAKKYLIIRFSSIGDIVLTTPVVRCLKKQTGAEVHFLTKKSFQTLLHPNPYVDKIFFFEKKIREVIPALKKENYDGVIDLHHNLRSWKIKRALSCPSFSFNKLNVEKWLLVNLKINRLPDVHIVERYLQAVSRLGVKNDGEGLDYFLPASPDELQKSIQSKVPGIDFEKPFVVFAIGAAHQTKRPTQEMIIKICASSTRPVILIGGKQEEAEGEFITKAAAGSAINTCGKLSLHESAFLIKKAEKVISPDTGMMHIAAAFRKKIISIWGNTVPEFGMYPYLPEAEERSFIFENKELSCRPCSKIGYEKCPRGHFKCMKDLPLESIIEKINE